MNPSVPKTFPFRATELVGEPLMYWQGKIDEIDQPNENIILGNSIVNGKVTGKTIKVEKTKIEGRIHSLQGHIWVKDCQELKHLEAEGSILALRCKIEEAAAKDCIDLYQSHAKSISAKCVSMIDSTAKKVILEFIAEFTNSNIYELECRAVNPKSSFCFKKSMIKNLKVSQAAKPQTANNENSTSIKNKVIIKLDGSFVNKIVFEDGIEGKVILIGASSIKEVVNGIVKRRPLLAVPECSDGYSTTDSNDVLLSQLTETKDPE